MLIYFYLFAMIVGFVLLGASILLGGHSDGADGGGPEADADAHGELDKDVGGHGAFDGMLTAFASMRFWTFFLAFAGLTGIVLDGLDLVPSEWITLVAAVVMGTGSGLGAVLLLRKLASETSGKAVESKDYVGKTAKVLVPFEGQAVGKVRVQIKGTAVDLLASSVDEEAFAGKDEVLIVEMEGNRARVARVNDRR